jgi:putative peptidoglycan lipid II flippase
MAAPRLTRSTAWIFALTLLSRISGFFRTSILAAYFGTSVQTDAWVMASALPSLLFGSVNQSVSVATVPAMTEARAHDPTSELQRFVDQVWSLLIFAALLMVALGEWLSPEMIHVLAPGFHGSERTMTVTMTRIMIPSIVFWTSSGFLTGILQSGENFFGLTLSPLVVNVVQIGGIIILGHFFSIYGVAWGFTAAIAAQLALLWPLLRRRGIRLRFTWHFNHPRLRGMLRLMGPYFLLSGAGNIELITDRVLASSMATGSISAMNFAFTVSAVPLGLIIAPIITPIFTRLAVYHSTANHERFTTLSMRGLRWVLLLALPLSLVLFILNVPILRAVYERGHFNAQSLTLTSHLFVYAILALPANSLSSYLQQMSFATKNTRRPAQYSLVGVAVNIVGNLILTRFLGVYGLVLATTLANWTTAALLSWSFHVRRHVVGQWPFVLALIISGTTMAAILICLSVGLRINHVFGVLALAGEIGLTAVVALTAYSALLLWLHVPEAIQLRSYAFKLARRLLAA